jgi:AraC-like DNA-binding protein
VVHDGRPGAAIGYRKRVLYVDTSVLPESLTGAAVDRPSLADGGLAIAVSDLHDAFDRTDAPLEAETRFALIAARIHELLGEPDAIAAPSADRDAAEALRAWLDARLFEPVTLAEAARSAGWSPAHLARAFTGEFGIAPHAYVIGRRLDAARDRILAGQPLSDVAAEVGFTDQAHLTHRFRRFLGTTPSRYRRAAGRTAMAGRAAAGPPGAAGP